MGNVIGALVKAYELNNAKVEMLRGKGGLYYVRFTTLSGSKTHGVYIQYAEAADFFEKLVAVLKTARTPQSA